MAHTDGMKVSQIKAKGNKAREHVLNIEGNREGKEIRLVRRAAISRIRTRCKQLDFQELVLANRETAFRLARRLLNRWGAQLESDEIQSLSDLALCEAARGFNPDKEVKFITYLFYYVKGALVRSIEESMHGCGHAAIIEEFGHDHGVSHGEIAMSEIVSRVNAEGAVSNECCPQRLAERHQAAEACYKAMSKLNELEREVVEHVHLLDFKVAQAARRLGYSRGYLSDVRRSAFRKLRHELTDWKEAA